MPDRKRINLYFTDEEDEELYGRIATIAAKEKRSISQTAKLLIVAALATIADQHDDVSELRAQPEPTAGSKTNGKERGKRSQSQPTKPDKSS